MDNPYYGASARCPIFLADGSSSGTNRRRSVASTTTRRGAAEAVHGQGVPDVKPPLEGDLARWGGEGEVVSASPRPGRTRELIDVGATMASMAPRERQLHRDRRALRPRTRRRSRDPVHLDGGNYDTEAIALLIECRDQAEVDHYWEALSDGGQVQQCGWLKVGWPTWQGAHVAQLCDANMPTELLARGRTGCATDDGRAGS